MEEEAIPEQSPNIMDHPVMEEVKQLGIFIEQAESILSELKQQIHEEIERLPGKIGDNEELFAEVVYHLYWFNNHVSKTAIKKAFNVVTQSHASKNSKNVIRPLAIELICRDCQQPFQTQASSLNNRGSVSGICQACWAQYMEERRANDEHRQRLHQAYHDRLRELATMPYYDYLQTPEWAERRKRAMKRAGYRCQVCNAYGVQLNTHHRTYERRGNEWDKDLITLCRTCHEIFHQNGQLAEE